MQEKQPVYVIDTNVLVDYVDVIPGEGGRPHEPTIELDAAHLVVPTVVVRELSNFKNEKSDRGRAARTVLRRLRNLFENDIHTIEEVYNLQAPVQTTEKGQLISIMPVHKDFRQCLPFHPCDGDMDGQIILTALAVGLLQNDMRVDGGELIGNVWGAKFDDVVLLTNDNGLAIRARERGLKTTRYGYKYPAPYTGRRDIIVPSDLLLEFLSSKSIPRTAFEQWMPEQPKLVANEFIVMEAANQAGNMNVFNPWENHYYENIGRYDADEDAIVPLRYIRNFPTSIGNAGEAIYADALANPEIAAVICTGPAGSGKTYMATVYGYIACKEGRFIGVTTVPCENRSNLGALPGDLDEKMDPDVQPLKNALRNYVLQNDPRFKKELERLREFGTAKAASRKGKNGNGNTNGNGRNSENGCDSANCGERSSIKAKLKDQVDLIWENWFSSIPIEVARGRDFSYELAIYDEFQDQNASQADTLIKRIGCDGKIIITGDIEQIHAPYLDQSNNGLVYASRQLFDNPMVAQVHFTEDEVVRHPLVQEVARRQRAASRQRGH